VGVWSQLLVENKREFRRFELFQEVECRKVRLSGVCVFVFDGVLFGGGVVGVFSFHSVATK
jgi:hypothetical protein